MTRGRVEVYKANRPGRANEWRAIRGLADSNPFFETFLPLHTLYGGRMLNKIVKCELQTILTTVSLN